MPARPYLLLAVPVKRLCLLALRLSWALRLFGPHAEADVAKRINMHMYVKSILKSIF